MKFQLTQLHTSLLLDHNPFSEDQIEKERQKERISLDAADSQYHF